MNDYTTEQFTIEEYFPHTESKKVITKTIRNLMDKGVTFENEHGIIYLKFPNSVKSRKVFDTYCIGEIRPIEPHDRLYDEWEIRNNPSEAYKWVLDLECPFRYFETPWDMSSQDICWTVSDCLHSVNHSIGIEPSLNLSIQEIIEKIEKE